MSANEELSGKERSLKWPVSPVNTPDPRLAPEAALGRFLFFQGLPRETREEVAKRILWRNYNAGSTIIRQSETDDDIFILFSGLANVIRTSQSGRGVFFDSIQSGNFFGELSVFDEKPRSATVIAKTDCTVGKMVGQEFLELVARYEKPALVLLSRLASMVRNANDRIANLSLLNAEQRICGELVAHVEADPGNTRQHRIYPVPTQLELADRAGVTRQTVARVFAKLTAQSIIERRGKVLHVRQYEKLQSIASVGKLT
jgi:CRP/FNR family transcriptional regulator, cyclic AMP receptor protein